MSTPDGQNRLPRPLAARLRLAMVRARLALAWERLWPALWPFVMVAGLFALYVLTGLPLLLPAWVRMFVLAGFVVAAVWSLRGLRTFRWPDEEAVLTRVERASGLSDHPLHALGDRVAAPADSPLARRLWARHVKRLMSRIGQLKAGWPRSHVPPRDPFALRNALGMALLVTLFLFGLRHLPQSVPAVLPEVALPASSFKAVDAWLTPPAYTGRPPIVLASGENTENGDGGGMTKAATAANGRTGGFSVPFGTRLSVRVTGARAPHLLLHALREDGRSAGRQLADHALARADEAERDAFKADVRLTRSVVAILRDGGELARWVIDVMPDSPPVVRLVDRPAATRLGGLKLTWEVEDDYGVASLKAAIDLAEPLAAAKPAEAPRSAAGPKALDAIPPGLPRQPLAYEPPRFTIPLPRLNPKKAKGAYTRDLAAHPWVGMRVRLVLEAEDQAGQKGTSRPLVFTLPGRAFRHPLARALMEQRRQLVLRPWTAREVAVMLAAFTAWPQGLIEDAAVYLGLRQAARRLYGARDEKTVREVVDALWHIAVRIEDGDLAEARKALQAARKALEEALERGASPEEIERLTQRLREAMNRYLESMAREARRRQGRDGQPMQDRAARQISPQDLQRMLDRIENLARTGSRDAARQLLAELDDLLQNLQPGSRAMAGSNPDAQMLSELQRLMREQQRLMDETWQARPRQPGQGQQRNDQSRPQGNAGERNRNGDPDHGPGNGMQGLPLPGGPIMREGEDGRRQARPGENGMQSGGSGGFGDLARRQQELARRLQELVDRMQRRGNQAPQAMGRAGEAMNRAGRALERGGKREALDSQRQALDALRRGARELARRMARQRGLGGGRLGLRQGRDPLGRPLRSYGEEYGVWENMVPDENAIERARRILEALRERAARPDRPKTELDYIDRLLRGLY